MRYFSWSAAFAALVLYAGALCAGDVQVVLPAKADEEAVKTKIPAVAKQMLLKANEWELYSLTKAGDREKPKEEHLGWKVLGKTTLKDAEIRKLLFAELDKASLNKTILDMAASFEPSLGIHARYDGKILDVLVCFPSGRAHVFVDEKLVGQFALSKEPQYDFEKVLTEAKVPLPTVVKAPEPLPGFPAIMHTAALLEVAGIDGKPLLKIVKVDYNKDTKELTWLIEVQTDLTYEDYLAIRKAWQNGNGVATTGPAAHFFDKDHVKLYRRDLKEVGELRDARKGDCVRLILETGEGFPKAASMEIRRP